MGKKNQCAICHGTSKLQPLVRNSKFGHLCMICYSQKHLELSRQGLEERLVRNAQRKLAAENQAFNDFIETGIVTIQKPNR